MFLVYGFILFIVVAVLIDESETKGFADASISMIGTLLGIAFVIYLIFSLGSAIGGN
jgi:uncharacterized membrane protein